MGITEDIRRAAETADSAECELPRLVVYTEVVPCAGGSHDVDLEDSPRGHSVERRSADSDDDGPRARSVYPSSAAGSNDVPHGLHTQLLPSRRPRGGKSGYQREREKRECEETTVAIRSAPWHQYAPVASSQPGDQHFGSDDADYHEPDG